MKENNKGFTLIEMLATIAIIAVVTLIATVTYSRVRRTIIDREYKNLKSLIEIAAVRYTSKTGKEKYFVEELIEEGYIDPDDEKGNIYDPRDDHSLNCHLVEVIIDNSNYDATLGNVNYRDKDGCKLTCPTGDCLPNDPQLSIVALIHDTQVNYLTATSQADLGSKLSKDPVNIYKNVKIVIADGARWTNRQLDITANLDPNLPYYVDIADTKYIWNGDAASVSTSNKHTTNMEVLYNAPYKVEAVMTNNKRYNNSFDYKFDNKAPEIKIGSMGYVNGDKDTWKKSKYIYFEVVEDGVGIDRIYIGKRPCSDLKKDAKMGVPPSGLHSHVQVYELKEETGRDGENGEVNFCAIDKLGNIVPDDQTKTAVIPKIDITPPHCTKDLKPNRKVDVVGEHNKYQYEDRKITQYCYDNNLINGVLVHGSGCTQTSYTKTFDPAVGTAIKTGKIQIKDKAFSSDGWTTNCTVDVYIDRKGPLCSKATGNTSDHVSNNGATTTGVGSTSNWDQNYRHITQYCYDEHSGCMSDNYSDRKSNPSKSDSWDYNDGKIIRTRKITIWDKVPRCSQKSADGVCASMNLDSNDNKYGKNNSTACTEGVYIDHVPPVNERVTSGFHGGNRIKAACSDPSWNGVTGSGVKTFTTIATTRGSSSQINPCKSSSDCSTSYDTTLSNLNGSKIEYKINFLSNSISYPADNVTINATCVDKADNTTVNDLEYIANLDDSTSYGRKYINEISGKENLGPSSGCILKQYRANSEQVCVTTLSYDCARKDTPCDANNSGEGSSCCLQGHDPAYGCKTTGDLKILDDYYKQTKYSQSSTAYYIKTGNSESDLYVAPKAGTTEYADYCRDRDGLECIRAYECKVFNCWADNPTMGNTTNPAYYVCGNFTK